MTTKYPFKNLAFQGGGIKTLAYQGAITVLEARGILPQIERVAGTSAGAVAAMLVSFRLSAKETNQIFNSIDFSRIPVLKSSKELSWHPPRILEPQVDRLISNYDALKRLFFQYGWYANERGYNWLHETIAAQCGGNGRATFGEFQARGFRDLHIVATNITDKTVVVFCPNSTPDVAVADAMLMTQTLPLYFESVKFDGKRLGQGDYYGDGGVLNNFPIHVFDRRMYATENEWFINGINWETLGLRLYTPDDCPGQNREITSLAGYISHLLEAVIVQQDAVFENSRADRLRTINISNCCVSLTDFHIKSDPADEMYQKLVFAGGEAALTYLDNYNLPTPDQLARFKRMLGRLWPL
jgi:NTE family protein